MKTIKTHLQNRILKIILNRPVKRNALNSNLICELTELFKKIKKDKNIKIVIVEGEGSSFCAGMDLEELKNIFKKNYSKHLKEANKLLELFIEIYESPKFVIGKINGNAFGGGAGLASLFDLICVNEDSKFCFSEVKIGFVPAIVSFFLQKRIQNSIVIDLLLTGRIFNSEEAIKIGFANRIFANSEFEIKVNEIANEINNGISSNSLFESKKIIKCLTKSEKNQLKKLAQINAKVRLSTDCKLGVTKFINKEKIIW